MYTINTAPYKTSDYRIKMSTFINHSLLVSMKQEMVMCVDCPSTQFNSKRMN